MNHWLPMPPLSGMTPLVVSSVAMPLRDAGPWHDAPVCSQMPMVARFAETATPEPLLDPRGTRSVSYGLQAWPAHALMAWPPATNSSGSRPVRRVARAGVELVRDGLRVDDRALGAQPRHDRGIERRHIHREGDVAVGRRPHVFRVERILERRDDAVHRQRGQVGIRGRTGASSSAARSSASGCWRNASHTAGAPAGSGPVDGWASKAPLQVTERSPRMLSVSSAFSCPALGMPTRMPVCAMTLGSETVGSIRPKSSGLPRY